MNQASDSHTCFRASVYAWDSPLFSLFFYTCLVPVAESFQLCSTFCNTMNCSPSGFSGHGISRQEYWSGLPFPSPWYLPNSGIEPKSPTCVSYLGRWILYCLSHLGSKKKLQFLLYKFQNRKNKLMVIEIRIMVNFRKVVIVKDGFGESYILFLNSVCVYICYDSFHFLMHIQWVVQILFVHFSVHVFYLHNYHILQNVNLHHLIYKTFPAISFPS